MRGYRIESQRAVDVSLSQSEIKQGSAMARLWNKIILSKDDVSSGKLDDLRTEFLALEIINDFPEGLSIVQRQDSAESHIFYIPPSSSQIARGLIQRYSGVPCPAPMRSEVIQYLGPICRLPFADD